MKEKKQKDAKMLGEAKTEQGWFFSERGTKFLKARN